MKFDWISINITGSYSFDVAFQRLDYFPVKENKYRYGFDVNSGVPDIFGNSSAIEWLEESRLNGHKGIDAILRSFRGCRE